MGPSETGQTQGNLEPIIETLKESERRFRTIYEVSPFGMIMVDMRTGRFVQCNSKFCEITGRTPDQLTKLDIQTITYPGDLLANLENMALLQEGKKRCFNVEKRYLRPDGSPVWVNITAVPMWREGEPPDYYVALVEDISARKESEKAQQRQATFDTLITQILGRFASCTGGEMDQEIQESLREVGGFIASEEVFVALTSPDLTTWSAAYEWAAPGHPYPIDQYQNVPMGQRPWVEQRLLSGELVQIAKPEDWPREAALERALYEEEGIQSVLLLPLRGRGRQVAGCIGLRTMSHPMQWSQEDIRRLLIFADALANILERQRVENALYDSRQMLQQILDTIPQRVFWKDLDLNYLGCNQPFAQDAGGADMREIVGKNDFQLCWPDCAEGYRADDRRVIESGEAKIGYEEQQTRPNGTIGWLRTSKVPLRDHQNRIFGVLGTYEDITAFRQARVALEQAKEAAEAANQAKDQFIAVLSHELRTPLTPVLAMVTALEETERLPSGLHTDLEAIHRNVELEARLIDDLLDVTRISQGKLILRQETVDAHACLLSAMDICEADLEAKRLKLSLKLNASHYSVWADPARLRQIFWNLLKNAIKFTPEQGQIEIRTSNDGSRLKIEVADTGIGIEPEAISRIFNAFEQGEVSRKRRFGGLGLGLSIAKALVEMHHGALTARSEGKLKGAVFTVELDTVAEELKAPAPVRLSEPDRVERRRILLVEDHEDTLRILARLLRKWGYGVTTACSVKSALERASEQQFDLLISDLGLPDGSGCEIVEQLASSGKLPAIALSGYGTDEDIRMSLDAGFVEHLIKPVSFQTLRLSVERLLP